MTQRLNGVSMCCGAMIIALETKDISSKWPSNNTICLRNYLLKLGFTMQAVVHARRMLWKDHIIRRKPAGGYEMENPHRWQSQGMSSTDEYETHVQKANYRHCWTEYLARQRKMKEYQELAKDIL